MTFGSPWILVGLALCTLPVLIHLLSRRQYRRESWAAMRFLRAACERRAQQLRLESLLLLLVRTLLIGLLVLALAEPLFQSVAGDRPPRAPLLRILVVDVSASMGRTDGRQRAGDRARIELQRLLDESLPGDAFHLVRIVSQPPWTVIRNAAFDPDEVLSEFDRLGFTAERGDVAGALQATVDLLRQSDGPERREVVVFSDWQRSNWLPAAAEERARVQRLLRLAARQAALRLVDVGGHSGGNLALISLGSSRSLVAPGQAFDVTARVRNYGAGPTSGRLEWLVNGRSVEISPWQADADAETAVTLAVIAPTDRHACEVEARLLTDDELPIDNRRFLSVPVRETLRVVLVEGRPAVKSMQGGTDFLRTALAPRLSSAVVRPRRPPITCRVVQPPELPQLDLQNVDCLWLCDVERLDEPQQHRLAEYVELGGGLIFSCGQQVDPAAANSWSTTAGGPLLPASLEAVVDADEREPPFVTFELTDPPHPLLHPFQGNPAAGLGTTLIRRYIRARPADDGSARIVARFSSGDPAIVERQLDLGRVSLVLTSVDDRWGSWPVWPSFLPMVHELVLDAAGARFDQPEHLVGGRVERRLAPAEGEVAIAVTTPGGQPRPATVRCDAQTCLLRLNDLSEPGFYRLDWGPPRSQSETLAVNVDVHESPPGRMSEGELATQLLSQTRYSYHTEWTSTGAEPAVARPTGSLAGMLLAMVVLLSVIELVIAWRSRWGLAILAGAGILGAAAIAFRDNLPAAMALVVLIAAAGVLLGQRLRPRLRAGGVQK